MNSTLIFNQKKYSISGSILQTVFSCMIENESRDEDGSLYALSFISNSIVQKTYDDLDYHEFILNPSFRVSALLCNIYNVFGQSAAKQYAEELSSYFDEEIEWFSVDYFNSLSVSDAFKFGKSIFSGSDLENFKELLSLIHLYSCVQEDYEQTLEDFSDYSSVLFINGIGVKRIEAGDKIILKPLSVVYDVPMPEYKDFSGVLVPPIIRAAVFKTEHNTSFTEEDRLMEDANLLFLKLEQITGSKLDRSIKKTMLSDAKLDTALVGKWYNVYKNDDHPVLAAMHYFSIQWFKEDGSMNKSVIFSHSAEIPSYENWSNLKFTWKTIDDQLVVTNHNINSVDKSSYAVSADKLIIGDKCYYRSFEEALKNC